jgi:hypothetical protein
MTSKYKLIRFIADEYKDTKETIIQKIKSINYWQVLVFIVFLIFLVLYSNTKTIIYIIIAGILGLVIIYLNRYEIYKRSGVDEFKRKREHTIERGIDFDKQRKIEIESKRTRKILKEKINLFKRLEREKSSLLKRGLNDFEKDEIMKEINLSLDEYKSFLKENEI